MTPKNEKKRRGEEHTSWGRRNGEEVEKGERGRGEGAGRGKGGEEGGVAAHGSRDTEHVCRKQHACQHHECHAKQLKL